MRPNLSKSKSPAERAAEAVVKDIRRATRRHFSAEDKIRIVLVGLRGEDSIASMEILAALPPPTTQSCPFQQQGTLRCRDLLPIVMTLDTL
jgi:transposase